MTSSPNAPKALIATNHLGSYAGSELVAMECAELLEREYDVTLFTNFISSSLAQEPILKRVMVTTDPPDLRDFEIAWIQHYMFPLLKGVDPKCAGTGVPVVVFAHLSPFEPFETPMPDVENAVASVVLANSPETAKMLKRFGIEARLVRIFPNPAPLSFRSSARRSPRPLESVLFVTNHLPDELEELATLLRDRCGLRTEHVGVGGVKKRVTPALLEQFSCVVTIGKTVQYCLQARVPVFCYDHFGGPGWLSEDNFELLAWNNFSGRCSRDRRSVDELVCELIDDYETAATYVLSLSAEVLDRFGLEPSFAALKSELLPRQDIWKDFNETRWQQYRRIARLVARESSGRFHALDQQEVLTEIIRAKDAEFAALRNESERQRREAEIYVTSLREALELKDRDHGTMRDYIASLTGTLETKDADLIASRTDIVSLREALQAKDRELAILRRRGLRSIVGRLLRDRRPGQTKDVT